MKKHHYLLLFTWIAGLLWATPIVPGQNLTLISPSDNQVYYPLEEIRLQGSIINVPIQDPTRLHVWNYNSGWRKLKLGHGHFSLYSNKTNVLQGGNQYVEILMKDHTGQTDWENILFRPQGSSTHSVSLAKYIPEQVQAGSWFLVVIPIQDFGSDEPFKKLSFLEFPYSADAGSWELSIASIRFTGGTLPFTWIGPSNYFTRQDGSGKPGQVMAEWLNGSYTGEVIPTLSFNINGNEYYSVKGLPASATFSTGQSATYTLQLIANLNGNPIEQTDPIQFKVDGSVNYPPLIDWSITPSEIPYPARSYIKTGITGSDPEGQAVTLKLFIDDKLIKEASSTSLITWVSESVAGTHILRGEVVDAAGQEVSIAREIHIIKAEEQTGLGSILQPADGSVINIPDSVIIVAEVDKKEGNAVTYIKVTNPDGGYRKLKIGNNPDRIYSPSVDVISGGNNTLEITMKDINEIADWSRLLVAPMEELANPVILGNYWNNAADLGGGWKKISIPLSDFDAGIDFHALSYIAFPYSKDAGQFILGISSIRFTGGTTPYEWFGQGHTNVRFDGDGSPGSLTAELIEGSSGGEDPSGMWLSMNDTLIGYYAVSHFERRRYMDFTGNQNIKLFRYEEPDHMQMTHSINFITSGEPPAEQTIEILLHFAQHPDNFKIHKSTLKYNKDFAYSFTYDDGLDDSYANAFKVLNGGIAKDQKEYPGLYYTDGCGNNIAFTGALAWYTANQYDQDLHVHTPGHTTWAQLQEMLNNKWDVLNHTYRHNAGEGTDYEYEVNENIQYVLDKTGMQMTHFVIPSGDMNYIPYAYAAGMKVVCAYNASFMGYPSGIRVDGVFPDHDVKIYRRFIYDDDYPDYKDIMNKIDEVAEKSVNGQHYWFNDFTHRISNDALGGSLRFDTFLELMQNIEHTYGRYGDDRIWMASLQDVHEYLMARDLSVLYPVWEGNDLRLVFDLSQVPGDLRRYALSVVIESSETFTAESLTDGVVVSYQSGQRKGLINVEEEHYKGSFKSGVHSDPSVKNSDIYDKGISNCTVYPNPAHSSLGISLHSGYHDNLLWYLYDMTGYRIMSGKEEINEGAVSFRINGLNHLSPGIYNLRLIQKDKLISKKIILQ